MEKKITTIPAKVKNLEPLAQIKKRKVCGYARVSTGSEEQETSYKSQIDYYTKYIKRNPSWEFVGLYSDDGISATQTKNREGFNRMIQDALDGKIDLIVTKSVSRFARNTVDSLTTIRKLKEKGVEVFFEKENIYTLDSKGELLITLMSSLSQEESRSISENTTWGRRRRMAAGAVSVGYKTFLGYDKGKDGKMVINKEQAKTIKLIYNLFLRGMSYYKIKSELEKRDLDTPCGGKRWHQATIRSILTNEKYMGDALLQKYYITDFLTKKTKKNEGELQQYYIEGDHEPIVSKTMFNAVKTEIAERGEQITKYAGTNIITKKLICGNCGGTLRRKLWHSNTKYRAFRYRCVNRYERTRDCDMRIIREEEIKSEFVKAVNEVIKNKKGIIEETRELLKSIDNVNELKIELANKTAEMQKISVKVDKLIKGNANKEKDQESYKAEYEELELKYNEAKIRAEAIEKEILDKNMRKIKIEGIISAYRHSKIITEFSEDLWNGLLDKCIVFRDHVEFTWK